MKKLCAAFAAALAFATGSAGAADICAANSNRKEMQANVPDLYRDFQTLEKLPLSGKELHAKLKDPANGIRTCKSSSSGLSEYTDRTAIVKKNLGTSVTLHEYFHAAQDLNGAYAAGYMLTVRDAALAELLSEATAVAYELVTEQEAADRGVPFKKAAVTALRPLPGMTITISRRGASDNPKIKAAFKGAYDAALAESGSEAKALSEAGKAAVRRVLEGDDGEWTDFYGRQAVRNLNGKLYLTGGDPSDDGYIELRRIAYAGAGDVSSKINIVPDELLGAGADLYIDRYVAKAGIILQAPVLINSNKPSV